MVNILIGLRTFKHLLYNKQIIKRLLNSYNIYLSIYLGFKSRERLEGNFCFWRYKKKNYCQTIDLPE